MKKADPSLEINVGLPDGPDWINPLFAEAGSMLSQVQVGFYFDDNEVTIADVVKTPSQVILPKLKSLRQQIDGTAMAGKRVGIGYYEWNVGWDRSSGDVLGGVFAAEMLNMFCRDNESLGLSFANYFQPVVEGAIKVEPLTSELEPDGQVFVMYSAHQGNRLLKTPAMTIDADIDLCASLTPDGKSIFATVINRNTTSARTLEVSLSNFNRSAMATVKFLIPISLEVGGKFVQRDEKLKVIDGNKVLLRLPPCAVARIQFE